MRSQGSISAPMPRRERRRQRWHIPACYDPPHDEDIAEVAEFLGFVSLRANHRPASWRALPCLYVWFCAGVYFSWRPARQNSKSRAAPRRAPPVPPGVAADRGRPGACRRLRHADRLVCDRPHAGQDVRSPARADFSRRHRRRDLFRADRWRSPSMRLAHAAEAGECAHATNFLDEP